MNEKQIVPKEGEKIDDKTAKKKKKMPIGLIIGIVAGVLALIVLAVLALYFLLRGRDDGNACEESAEELAEETVIYPDTTVTIDNPLFTTTVQNMSDDIFGDEFEEGTIERIFSINSNGEL